MTDTQQKCFMAVAEHLSFSKAADTLYVSQPAVSKAINALEDELKVALFARQGKHVSLTRAGEIFRDFLEENGRAYRSVMERISNLDRDIRSGTVTIGCDVTWNASNFFTRLEDHFSANHPGMTLDIIGMEPDSFLPALRDKQADVIIMYSCDVKKHPDIVALPFASIGCGFLCSSALHRADGPSLNGLNDQPFLVVDSATEKSGKLIYNTMFLDLYKNVQPSPILKHSRSLASAQLAVSCGKGVMFVDSWTGAVNDSRFHYYPIEKNIDLCVAYLSANKGTHIQFFVDEAVKLFAAAGTII